MNKKPRIYISSTIYDFSDLRSALKFWFENFGYDVMLSEFNDFKKNIDENSYQACLSAIKQSDYYILLLGSRIGGYYNKTDKTSITRMEFRTAYDLAQNNKIKIITFVRKEIWDIKEDRKQLRKYLEKEYCETNELDDNEIEKITNHTSSFVNDSKILFDFLDEIGKVKEMKKAIEGCGKFPKSNWIHQFSSFEDIIKTLKIEFDIKNSLNIETLKTNLKYELIEILKEFIFKNNDSISRNIDWGIFARKCQSGGFKDVSEISGKNLKRLLIYIVSKTDPNKFSLFFIEQALNSGLFQEYDKDTNTYRIGLLHKQLLQLRKNIQRLKNFNFDNELLNFFNNYSSTNNPKFANEEYQYKIPNEDLLYPFVYLDCEENIINLIMSILKELNGIKQTEIVLNPNTPISEEVENMAKENPSIEDINKWIGL